MYLVHPALLDLIKYDEKNGTKLSAFLLCYLECNGNMAKTAQKMYIHRNTANNWFHTISEIVYDDLENADIRFRLMLSYKLIDYYRYYKNASI